MNLYEGSVGRAGMFISSADRKSTESSTNKVAEVCQEKNDLLQVLCIGGWENWGKEKAHILNIKY